MPGRMALCGAAEYHWPPRSSLASKTVVSNPASSACFAATSPLGPAPTTATRMSGLRDHEDHGQDGERDTADGEQADGAKPQRHMATGAQRRLQLARALRTREQQTDRQGGVPAPEHDVRPRGDMQDLWREAPDRER